MTREEVWNIWRYHPAAVGRMVGFRDLTDELHGKWMQHILYGTADYTLQAHRLSYKSSCLSVHFKGVPHCLLPMISRNSSRCARKSGLSRME